MTERKNEACMNYTNSKMKNNGKNENGSENYKNK